MRGQVDIWTPAVEGDVAFFRRSFANGPGATEPLGVGRVASPRPWEKRPPLLSESDEPEEEDVGSDGAEEPDSGSERGSVSGEDDDLGDEEVGSGEPPIPHIDTPGLARDEAGELERRGRFKGVANNGRRWVLAGGLSAKDASKKATPLVFAIVCGNAGLVQALLELGASPLAGNALAVAERNGQGRVLEALRAAGGRSAVAALAIERRPSPFAPDGPFRSPSRAGREEGRPGGKGKKSARRDRLAAGEGDGDSIASDDGSERLSLAGDDEDTLAGSDPPVPRWRKDLVGENESRRKERQRSRQKDRDSKTDFDF
ncbi:hypothetical protein DFJ74DRAFT_694528 [Hyaloraphidium curvatum]|nr:hypothetical protein DFJ74DRAFT_694528 [Hyaloraphidium curvatum]